MRLKERKIVKFGLKKVIISLHYSYHNFRNLRDYVFYVSHVYIIVITAFYTLS